LAPQWSINRLAEQVAARAGCAAAYLSYGCGV
jgi:hypothetical protein